MPRRLRYQFVSKCRNIKKISQNQIFWNFFFKGTGIVQLIQMTPKGLVTKTGVKTQILTKPLK